MNSRLQSWRAGWLSSKRKVISIRMPNPMHATKPIFMHYIYSVGENKSYSSMASERGLLEMHVWPSSAASFLTKRSQVRCDSGCLVPPGLEKTRFN